MGRNASRDHRSGPGAVWRPTIGVAHRKPATGPTHLAPSRRNCLRVRGIHHRARWPRVSAARHVERHAHPDEVTDDASTIRKRCCWHDRGRHVPRDPGDRARCRRRCRRHDRGAHTEPRVPPSAGASCTDEECYPGSLAAARCATARAVAWKSTNMPLMISTLAFGAVAGVPALNGGSGAYSARSCMPSA